MFMVYIFDLIKTRFIHGIFNTLIHLPVTVKSDTKNYYAWRMEKLKEVII